MSILSQGHDASLCHATVCRVPCYLTCLSAASAPSLGFTHALVVELQLKIITAWPRQLQQQTVCQPTVGFPDNMLLHVFKRYHCILSIFEILLLHKLEFKWVCGKLILPRTECVRLKLTNISPCAGGHFILGKLELCVQLYHHNVAMSWGQELTQHDHMSA